MNRKHLFAMMLAATFALLTSACTIAPSASPSSADNQLAVPGNPAFGSMNTK